MVDVNALRPERFAEFKGIFYHLMLFGDMCFIMTLVRILRTIPVGLARPGVYLFKGEDFVLRYARGYIALTSGEDSNHLLFPLTLESNIIWARAGFTVEWFIGVGVILLLAVLGGGVSFCISFKMDSALVEGENNRFYSYLYWYYTEFIIVIDFTRNLEQFRDLIFIFSPVLLLYSSFPIFRFPLSHFFTFL